MSSVPVQLLIYVQPEPYCGNAPKIVPLQGCLEVVVGAMTSFNVTVINQCDWTYTSIGEIVVSKTVVGLQTANLTVPASDPSVVSMEVTWTPQSSQIGAQMICFIAFTE